MKPGVGDHMSVYRNLRAAIPAGVDPMADGRQRRVSLELANAITCSSYTRSEVELPLDSEKYAALLAHLKARHRR